MGEILGMASTHWPLLIPPDDGHRWPFQMVMERTPGFPEELKNPSSWPEEARVEFCEDEGVPAHKEHRERLVKAFRVMKDEIDAFKPDFILMFGDDQYQNFKEDIIPRNSAASQTHPANASSRETRSRVSSLWFA